MGGSALEECGKDKKDVRRGFAEMELCKDRWDSCSQLFIPTGRFHVIGHKSWSAERTGDYKERGIFSVVSLGNSSHGLTLQTGCIVDVYHCFIIYFGFLK